ncbi:MAG: YbaK/EbsC family protein [Candidatus Aenigmatarchaeota archaeon]
MGLNDKLLKAIEKLKKIGINYKILEFNEAARTSSDVARLYGINPREIIKTLIVKTDDNRFFAVMLPGILKIDNKKLLKELNAKKDRFLNEDELKNNTEFEPGEVCPILIEKIPILVDKTVFETENINFGSGDLYFGIEIKSKDLYKAIKIEKIVDIVKF